MRDKRTIGHFALALLAVALGVVAQRWFVQNRVSDALILYGIAALVFVLASWRLGPVWQQPQVPVEATTLTPQRRRWGFALLALAILASALALNRFRIEPPEDIAWILYLLSILLFIAAVYALDGRDPRQQFREWWRKLPARKWELAGLALILLLAVFCRLYQINTIPSGVFFDEAENGLDAKRVLEEGFHPVYFETNYGRGALFIYLLAFAFKLFGPGVFVMRLVVVVLGLLTVLAFYHLARLIFGPSTSSGHGDYRVGLIAAFLLALSRWHINFSRIVFDAILLPLLQIVAYYFFLKGLRTRRRLDFMWAGLALGLGLHTYAAFRAIPFVLIVFFIFLIADAALRRRNFLREFGLPLVAAVFAACLVFAPLGQYALRHRRAFMDRTQATSIFTKRDQADITEAIRSNTRLHLLMFNWRGDRNGRHNLPGEPMLDFASGILFVIGLGYALSRWREPPFFLFLVSFFALLMGGLLSVDFEAPQSLRSFGVLPAVYVFISAVLERLWVAFKRGFGEKWRWVFLGGVAILLAFIGFRNYHTYFYRQARDFAVWNAFHTAESLTAKEMKALGSSHQFYVTSLYYEHPTVRFLAPEISGYKRVEVGDNLPLRESDRPVVIFLDPQKEAMYRDARRFYPGAEAKEYTSPYGGPVVLYAVKLDLQDLASVQGLVARYYEGEDWQGQPAIERREARLDVDWSADPPLPLPFSAEWEGVLYVPRYGAYVMGISAPGEAEVLIDEYPVLEEAAEHTIMLAKGNHALRVRAVGASGRVKVYWQPPGESRQPLPAWALYTDPPVTNNGLLGSYYPNPNWASPRAFAQIDPAIAMFFHATPLGRPYTVEWQGMIAAPQSGDYAFATSSIDESQVYIDGQLVVDNQHRNQYVEGRISLTAGLHQINIRYADRSSHSFIQFFWRPPGRGQEIVPASVLLPPQGDYPPIEEVVFAEVSPPPAPVQEALPLPTPMPAPDMSALQALPARTLAVWGETGSGSGQFEEPVDLAVDGGGNVYVADLGNKRVQKFDSNGGFLAAWEGGDEPFVEPLAVATGPGGEVWVLDSYTNWAHRFDREGQWQGKVGGPESGFFHARGLVVDEGGVLYVADTGTSRVVKYSRGGEKIGEMGEIGWRGSGPGELNGPVGLAIDEDGLLYEADVDNRRLQVLERDGTYVRAWAIPESHTVEGHRVAVGGEWVYVTDPPHHRVLVYGKEGELIGGWGREGGGEGEFRRPMGIGVGPDGSVYVADSRNNRIQRFTIGLPE